MQGRALAGASTLNLDGHSFFPKLLGPQSRSPPESTFPKHSHCLFRSSSLFSTLPHVCSFPGSPLRVPFARPFQRCFYDSKSFACMYQIQCTTAASTGAQYTSSLWSKRQPVVLQGFAPLPRQRQHLRSPRPCTHFPPAKLPPQCRRLKGSAFRLRRAAAQSPQPWWERPIDEP